VSRWYVEPRGHMASHDPSSEMDDVSSNRPRATLSVTSNDLVIGVKAHISGGGGGKLKGACIPGSIFMITGTIQYSTQRCCQIRVTLRSSIT
jgi:hypothetical protein